MRVFVYEHLCAVPGSAPSSLRAEGRAMLSAVLADFAAVPDVEVVTLLAADLWPPLPVPPAVHVRMAADGLRQQRQFRSLAADADWTLVIAPETGLVLRRYCCWVEDVGGRLLGPSPEFIARTTDKLDLGERWRAARVRTPHASRRPIAEMTIFDYPLVLKPRDGAGSQATFLVPGPGAAPPFGLDANESLIEALLRPPDKLVECDRAARAAGFCGSFLVTEYVPGQAASVAVLAGPTGIVVLPSARQHLSDDGRFQYQGGSLPLDAALNERAQRLAVQAVRAVPGLFGYVGVDLVLGEAADGSQDYAIEINPRLTTSYLGYRRLCKTNLAAAMRTVCQGGTPQLDWHPGPIQFSPSDDASG